MKELAKALAESQKKLHSLGKNALAKGKFSYKYLTLDKLIEETRDVLAEKGLTIIQPMCIIDGQQALKTILLHTSGESIEGVSLLESEVKNTDTKGGNNLQRLGSGITYIRRYALAAMLNIAQADDDGECMSITLTNAKNTIKETRQDMSSCVCTQCDKPITEKVREFSEEKLGSALCYECQQDRKKNDKTIRANAYIARNN